MVCLLGFLSTGLGIAAPAKSLSQPKSQSLKSADGAQSHVKVADGTPKGPLSKLALNEKPKTSAAKKPAGTPGARKQPNGTAKTQSPKPGIKGPPPVKNISKKAKAPIQPGPKKSQEVGLAKGKNKGGKLKSGAPKTAVQKAIKPSDVTTRKGVGSGALSATGKKVSKTKQTVKDDKPKALTPPESSGITVAEDETDWLSLGLGIAVLALGLGALFWHRKRQKVSKNDDSIDFQSSDSAVSTFVSNVTAFDLDSKGDTGTGAERRGKGPKAKPGRAKQSEHPSMTQADQQMMEATPLPTIRGTQQIAATNPPASNAPSQIVVPKKSKTPAAS